MEKTKNKTIIVLVILFLTWVVGFSILFFDMHNTKNTEIESLQSAIAFQKNKTKIAEIQLETTTQSKMTLVFELNSYDWKYRNPTYDIAKNLIKQVPIPDELQVDGKCKERSTLVQKYCLDQDYFCYITVLCWQTWETWSEHWIVSFDCPKNIATSPDGKTYFEPQHRTEAFIEAGKPYGLNGVNMSAKKLSDITVKEYFNIPNR